MSCLRAKPRASTRSVLRAGLLVWWLGSCVWLSAACGASLPREIAVEPPPARGEIEALRPGSALALKRPTKGVALLSLWIDAGARDAQVAQLATAAAFYAADKVAGSARILAEGTELRLLCELAREPLTSCATRLLKALALPAPSAPEMVKVRERIRAARALAARDDAQAAEQYALSALLGEGARPLYPLGDERGDGSLEGAAVHNFLARFYTPDHALLVGLGEVEQRELQRALASSKRRGPPAARTRSALKTESGLRVEIGESAQIALALPTGSLEQAASLCQRFREIHGDASARISLLHGLVLAHLTLPAGSEPYARMQSAVFDLRRLFLEPTTQAPLPPPDTLEELARAVGERWIARGAAPQAGPALGVGFVIRRDERTPTSDEETLGKARARAESAIEAGTKNSAGEVRGELGAEGGRVESENGARIEILRRPGEAWFAAAVRFEGGSELDAPNGHGRAALLATLLSDGCGVAQGRSLDLSLASVGARLIPLVDAEGLGVALTAPRERAFQALDLLLRCALRPAFQARSLEDARARTLQALWNDDALLLQAALGQLLSPAAPGLVAPWGTPAGISRVELTELKRQHALRALGPNLSVLLIGDVPPRESAAFVARRLSYLPAKEPPELSAQAGSGPEVVAALVGDARLRVIVGVHVAGGKRGQLGAEVFAAAFAEALARRVGGVSFATGHSARGHSFAGVALTLRDDQIEGTKPHASAALRELSERADAPYRNALIKLQAQHSQALSSARGTAQRWFRGQRAEPLDFAAELAVIRKLAKEAPSFFVLRPRP